MAGWNTSSLLLNPVKNYLSLVYIRRTNESTSAIFFHTMHMNTIIDYDQDDDHYQNASDIWAQNFSVRRLPLDVWCLSVVCLRSFEEHKDKSPFSPISVGGVYRLDTKEKVIDNALHHSDIGMQQDWWGGSLDERSDYTNVCGAQKIRLFDSLESKSIAFADDFMGSIVLGDTTEYLPKDLAAEMQAWGAAVVEVEYDADFNIVKGPTIDDLLSRNPYSEAEMFRISTPETMASTQEYSINIKSLPAYGQLLDGATPIETVPYLATIANLSYSRYGLKNRNVDAFSYDAYDNFEEIEDDGLGAVKEGVVTIPAWNLSTLAPSDLRTFKTVPWGTVIRDNFGWTDAFFHSNGRANPDVVFEGGGGTGAKASVVLDTAGGARAIVTKTGHGYTSPPKMIIRSGMGRGAKAEAIVDDGVITAIDLTHGGSHYTDFCTVEVSGGSGAVLDVRVRNGVILSVSVTEGGCGYVAPTIRAVDSAGEGAVLEAVVSSEGLLTGVNVLCGGQNYSSPTFVITRQEYFASAVAGSIPKTVGGTDLHYVAKPQDIRNLLIERENGAWVVRGGARVLKGMRAEEGKVLPDDDHPEAQ